ncbi:MAG: hypothetical protein WAV78_25570 [Xanthobacteraceae bacterium]
MDRQSATPRKKRGSPATGKGEPILVRFQPAQLGGTSKGPKTSEVISEGNVGLMQAVKRLRAPRFSAPADGRPRRGRGRDRGIFLGFVLSN